VLLGREFQDFDPATVKERPIYFPVGMVSDSEGDLQVVGAPQVSAALVLLDGRGGGFGRCCLRSLGELLQCIL